MKELESVLQDRFELVFTDKSLLETAFTHTSYANEHRLLKISHNERLEFLGDAVLQLLISEYLFKKYPKKPEGDLSKLRAMIVREESLAGFARDCQFDQFIKLGKGEEKSGGRNRDTILGACSCGTPAHAGEWPPAAPGWPAAPVRRPGR